MDAADVMTRRVITVTPETAIIEAARLMLQHRISGLPVADEGGTVVGVFAEGDLLRALVDRTPTVSGDCSDDQIRRHILAMIAADDRLSAR